MMGITDYFRVLKVNGNIEVRIATFVANHEYRKFYVSENVEENGYDVYRTRFNDLKELFDHMKRILSEKDYEMFLFLAEQYYYPGFIENYNDDENLLSLNNPEQMLLECLKMVVVN